MKKTIKLKGERIDLIIPTRKYADDIVKHINDKNISRYMCTVPYPYRRKDAEFYIKDMVGKQLKDRSGYPFSIYEKEHGEVIGGMGLNNLDRKNKHAEIGYWIGKRFWRKGYASEALALLLRFAFVRLKLQKVHVRAYHRNKASLELIRKFGFVHEGIRRRHHLKDNKWHDEFIFSLLREEYDKKN